MKSMTGFGRAEIHDPERRVTAEIKSVNHRYLDFNIKLPKKLGCFEAAIRALLKEYMERGKADVFISCEDYTAGGVEIAYNREAAKSYLGYFRQMEEEFGLENDVRVSFLARCPEVLTLNEGTPDEEALWAVMERALREAAGQLTAARAAEGRALFADVNEKLDRMTELLLQVEKRSPQILADYRERLETKMRELLSDTQIEESRIAAEVILFADKICTDEETVRLKSHIESMRRELLKEGSIGRRLDFIAQEMNREANTILSKANDLETSDTAISLKTEIEKIREQIQNIE